MTVKRWFVGTVTLAVLGSVGLDVGHSPVQVALADSSSSIGYCEDSMAANGATAEPTPTDHKADAELTAEAPLESDESPCPTDMLQISGEFCQVVGQICAEYISEKKDRCARYRNKVRCFGKSRQLNFCIDRYEYPNQAGVKPTVAVTWDEARELCATEGKRLCTADEWTKACEGPDNSPYPYGFVRDAEACNHDRPYIIPDDNAYQNPRTRAKEVERVSQSEASGNRASCVSAYGVFDMTGNVDEWVLNEAGNENGPEFQSGLKGGYWGPVRNRCRPATTDHNRWHHGYQIGFRCCADLGRGADAPNSPAMPNDKAADGIAQMAADSLVSRS